MEPESTTTHITQTKQSRKDLDNCLRALRENADRGYTGNRHPDHAVRSSCERSVAITKIQEATMWLGMDLRAINEEVPGSAPNPYPESYNPASPKIEPTSEGLKL